MSDAVDRLSKLVAQADNASTPEEAKTYMEKAERMSEAIGVELAVARAHALDKTKVEMPTERNNIQINSWSARPIHRQAMMDLWLEISQAHSIRCTISHDNYLANAYGFGSDIDISIALFGMLSLAMVREADAAIKRGEQKYVIDERRRTIGQDARIYRRQFYEGFTARVAGRLYAARKAVIKETDEAGSGGTEMVLRNKSQEVSDFYDEKVKHLSLRGSYKGLDNSDVGTSDALRDGANAGSRAQLGLASNDVEASKRRALS